MRMGPVSFSALFAILPLALSGQRHASVGVGTGVVRYAGGSSFSAITVSPAAQRLSPWSYVGLGGALSLLEDGEWAGQGRGDVWTALSRDTIGTRFAVSASIAASTRSDGAGAGSASVLIETVRDGAAIGAGVVTGVIEGFPGVGAARVRARGWWQFTNVPAQVSLSVEGTRLLGAWYTDVVGGVTLDRNRIVGSLWASGRLSKSYGSTGAASVAFQYFVSPSIAVEASGGNYLRDPFQGLPQAGFVTGGVRFYSSRRALTPAPARQILSTLEPLVAEHRGDTAIVRFRMPGAQSVAIAGNWNAWTPAPLRAVGDDIWEAALRLAPGVYYFNLVVDKEWVVPGGVATIPDGMGGLIAVLNVL